MSHRIRVRSISVIIILAVCLLAIGGLNVVDLAHFADRGDSSHLSDSQAAISQSFQEPLTECPKTASVTALVPEAPYAAHFGQQYADYERIQVDVRRDGSIAVLGQTMAMDDLLVWLRDQRDADIDTCVSVRADGDCQYLHVGRIVQMCQDLGVPTLMLPTASSESSQPTRVGGPA
jgi:biopolymer transport protein ExbD